VNKLELASVSTVGAVIRHPEPPGPAYDVVLRCFECDWGMTVPDWATACNVGIEHEQQEHGKARL